MIMNTAYSSKNNFSNLADLSVPLKINCAGFFRVDSDPGITTFHPEGRKDYQLIYIASGKGHFVFEGKEHTVTKGHMVLFTPGDAMDYYYRKDDKTDVFWVHFTGSSVSEQLSQNGIAESKHIFFPGVSQDYRWFYEQIIRELQLKHSNYEEMSSLFLRQLLLLVNRYGKEDCLQRSDVANEIEKAIRYFNENYLKDISIEDYAKEHNISKNWFIHCFKRVMNVTPMHYILSLRISAAKAYIENTDKNITEISNAVGYDNPLYFSRIFRKFTGVSPSAYKKSVK